MRTFSWLHWTKITFNAQIRSFVISQPTFYREQQ